jgi:hypothetical protein
MVNNFITNTAQTFQVSAVKPKHHSMRHLGQFLRDLGPWTTYQCVTIENNFSSLTDMMHGHNTVDSQLQWYSLTRTCQDSLCSMVSPMLATEVHSFFNSDDKHDVTFGTFTFMRPLTELTWQYLEAQFPLLLPKFPNNTSVMGLLRSSTLIPVLDKQIAIQAEEKQIYARVKSAELMIFNSLIPDNRANSTNAVFLYKDLQNNAQVGIARFFLQCGVTELGSLVVFNTTSIVRTENSGATWRGDTVHDLSNSKWEVIQLTRVHRKCAYLKQSDSCFMLLDYHYQQDIPAYDQIEEELQSTSAQPQNHSVPSQNLQQAGQFSMNQRGRPPLRKSTRNTISTQMDDFRYGELENE